MGTALVVGLLVVMCGGIAYVGDLLGRRMGKRRLSLFGLRPRYTAIVFTIVTGMVIAALTLGVLMVASRSVRIAVTRGEQLLYDNHRLKEQRQTLQRLRRQLTAEKGALEATNMVLAKRNVVLHAQEEQLRGETGRLQQQTQALQTKNAGLSRRNAGLEERSARLTQNNLTLAGRNRSLAAGNEQLVRRNSRLARANHRLVTANTQLQAHNRGLEIAKNGLVRARDLAQAQLTKLHSDLIQTQTDLTQAQANLLQANGNAVRVAESMRRQSERGQELATGLVVVHTGEELARSVIPAGAPIDSVRGALQGLLNAAQREVDRRVSRVHGPARHVRINPRGGSPDRLLDQTVLALMTESHPIDGQLPTMPVPEIHPLVVRAVASENEAAESGEPVEVDVVGGVNQLAFHRGEEITSLELPAASTSGQLLKDLVGFLQGQVRAAAIEHSIVPDASGSVGEIDYDPLLEVIRKVKRMPGWVKVGAVAAAETWSAGPLRLDFYVVPAETRVATDHKAK